MLRLVDRKDLLKSNGAHCGNPVRVARHDGWLLYFEYDRKHRRTKETQRDDQGQDIYAWAGDNADVVKKFIWDSQDVLLETDAGGVDRRRQLRLGSESIAEKVP